MIVLLIFLIILSTPSSKWGSNRHTYLSQKEIQSLLDQKKQIQPKVTLTDLSLKRVKHNRSTCKIKKRLPLSGGPTKELPVLPERSPASVDHKDPAQSQDYGNFE